MLNTVHSLLHEPNLRPVYGRLVSVGEGALQVQLPSVRMGDLCELRIPGNTHSLYAEVVRFSVDGLAELSPFGSTRGVSDKTLVRVIEGGQAVTVGAHLRGRVLNGLGHICDGLPVTSPHTAQRYPIFAAAPDPLQRPLIKRPFWTGVRAIDSALTLGEGQRIGIFAPAGVGKSTLLSMLALYADIDVIVVGLIGERGREVGEFLELLGTEGRARSVIIVATSDSPAIVRVNAAYVTTAVAEYFRDQGQRVLLLMDSFTRFARARREIGLAAGEPAVRRGYPPSVFSAMPQLLERTGSTSKGSISAIYTILVEGNDFDEPIADEVRSIVDGHIILSRDLADAGRYPAIDILASLSRLALRVCDTSHLAAATELRRLLTICDDIKLSLDMGEYEPGHDADVDKAVLCVPKINVFLAQNHCEPCSPEYTVQSLIELVNNAP